MPQAGRDAGRSEMHAWQIEAAPGVPQPSQAGPMPYGAVPMATPLWNQPPAAPPPVPPPSFVGSPQPSHPPSDGWGTAAGPESAVGGAGSLKSIRSKLGRRRYRSAHKDSSYLALVFLIGAGLFLLGVVILMLVSLAD